MNEKENAAQQANQLHTLFAPSKDAARQQYPLD